MKGFPIKNLFCIYLYFSGLPRLGCSLVTLPTLWERRGVG